MDEPVPIRRAAIGCLLVALTVVALALIVRPAIFTFAEPRGDSAMIIATSADVTAGPIERQVLLTRSYGWDGERDAGDGRAQLSVIVSPSRFGGLTAVAGGSPLAEDCPLDIGADRLTDCDGHEWSFEGDPLDPADPTLDRFLVEVVSGSVVVDLTRTLEP